MFDLTPNLSNSYHPVPKVFKQPKLKTPLNRMSKKVVAWEDARKELKALFKTQGITSCEVQGKNCRKNNFLGFAHTRRRSTLTPDQISDPHFVVLACQPDHEEADFKMDRKEAEALLDGIVAQRGW